MKVRVNVTHLFNNCRIIHFLKCTISNWSYDEILVTIFIGITEQVVPSNLKLTTILMLRDSFTKLAAIQQIWITIGRGSWDYNKVIVFLQPIFRSQSDNNYHWLFTQRPNSIWYPSIQMWCMSTFDYTFSKFKAKIIKAAMQLQKKVIKVK